MRVLLTAINAKFIHSSLAIRSLKKYAASLPADIQIAEYTINHQIDAILEDLYARKPDVVCFSCYLWNISMVYRIGKYLKKILPGVRLFLGGPEVSYDAKAILQAEPAIDMVMVGEGEATFFEVIQTLLQGGTVAGLPGTVARDGANIVMGAKRAPIELDSIPFAYDTMEEFHHRICYYETQRGCPYQCQYCLSSVEEGVRFLSLERVRQDLQFFLDANVRQVKFVDRTFNANKTHARGIWEYLIAHDNGCTNFHMEITADILDEETIALLANARPGLFQFEIGVQTTNPKTMEAIKRRVDFEKLSVVVKRIKALGNIHQHLDLIAGLPYEDFASFGKSFNDVYALAPEQLQLGFLKLLKGAGLRRDAERYGILYRDEPVYEVLCTPALPYEDIQRLKHIEELVELYYNSGKTPKSISWVVHQFENPFAFYQAFAAYWEQKRYFQTLHNKMELYFLFYEFALESPVLKGKSRMIRDMLKFDIYLNDNVRSLPAWIPEEPWEKESRWAFYNDEKAVLGVCACLANRNPKQLSKTCNLAYFEHDVLGDGERKKTAVLFDYSNKDGFFGHCARYPAPYGKGGEETK